MKHYDYLNFKKYGLRSAEHYDNEPNPTKRRLTKVVEFISNGSTPDRLYIPKYLSDFSTEYAIINFCPYDIDNMSMNIRKEFYAYKHKFLNISDMMNVFINGDAVYCTSAAGYDSVIRRISLKELRNFEIFFNTFFSFKFLITSDSLGDYSGSHHLQYEVVSHSMHDTVKENHRELINILKGRGVYD